MRTLTVEKLVKICSENRYIFLRYATGEKVAINCKVAGILLKQSVNFAVLTNYIGYEPCNFDQYISRKIPFIVKK